MIHILHYIIICTYGISCDMVKSTETLNGCCVVCSNGPGHSPHLHVVWDCDNMQVMYCDFQWNDKIKDLSTYVYERYIRKYNKQMYFNKSHTYTHIRKHFYKNQINLQNLLWQILYQFDLLHQWVFICTIAPHAIAIWKNQKSLCHNQVLYSPSLL